MPPLTAFKDHLASKREKPRRAWRNRSKGETAGHCSAGIRAAVAALWPPDGDPPPWLTAQRRDGLIRDWLWERGGTKPHERTIRRFFRERA